VQQDALDRLRGGITIDGIHYGPIEATLDREQGANVWLTVGIREGKNREVRKVLETLRLKVNRLIRVAFGPFELGDLDDGAVREIETEKLRETLGPEIAAAANADFYAPIAEPVDDTIRARDRTSAAPQRGARPSSRKRDEEKERPSQKRWEKRERHRRDRTGGPRPSRPRPK
jgi:23S rRNA pseudouridine2605 synthase